MTSVVGSTRSNSTDNEENDFDSELSLKILITKLKEEVFSVCMLLKQETYVAGWLVTVGFIVEYCQILGIVFSSSAIPWGNRYREFLSSITQLLDRGIWVSSTRASASLYIAMCVVIVLLVMGVLVAHLFKRNPAGDTNQNMLMKVFRPMVSFFSSVMYIPMLKIFVDAMNSSNPVDVFLGTILALIYSALVAAVISCVFDMDWRSKSKLARASATCDLAYLGFKAAIVVTFGFGSESEWILAISMLLTACPVAYLYAMYIPYYRLAYSKLRLALLASLAWSGFCIVVSNLQSSSVAGGAVYMFIGGTPLLFLMSATFVSIRLYQISLTPVSSLKNAMEAELKLRTMFMELQTKQLLTRSNAEASGEADNSDEEESASLGDDAKQEASELYWKLRDTLLELSGVMPNSQAIHVLLGHICFRFLNIKYLGFLHLESVSESEMSPSEQFHVYDMIAEASKGILENEANREVVIYLRFTKYLELAKKHDQALANNLYDFWTEVIKFSPDSEKLRRLSTNISRDAVEAGKNYVSMNSTNADSVVGLQWFGGFLIALAQEVDMGNKILRKAMEIELRKRDSTFKSLLFSRDAAIIVLSAEGSRLGEIVDLNDGFAQMFGHQKSNTIGKNIMTLMPEPFSSVHHVIMSRNLRTGRSSVVDQKRVVVGLHKQGHVFLATIFVKAFVHESRLAFMGVLDHILKDEMALVCNQDGLVTGATFPFMVRMDVKKEDLHQRLIKIYDIIPEYDSLKEQILNLASDSKGIPYALRNKGEDEGAIDTLLLGDRFPLTEKVEAIVIRFSEDTEGGALLTSRSASESAVQSARSKASKSSERSAKLESRRSTEPRSESNRDKESANGKSFAGESSGKSSTDQRLEEVKQRKQEEYVLRLLRKSTLTAIAIVLGLSVAALFMYDSLQSQHDLILNDVLEAKSRLYDLTSIAFFVRNLELQQQGILPTSPELVANDKAELLKYTNDLFEKNLRALDHRSLWNSVVQRAYDTAITLKVIDGIGRKTVTSMTLADALVLVVGKAQLVFESELNELDDTTEKVYFLLRNPPYAITVALDSTVEGYRSLAKQILQEMVMLLYVYSGLSVCAIFLLGMYALRPTIYAVLDEKDEVFAMFFLIPREVLLELMQPCLERIELFTSSSGNAVEEQAGIRQEEEEVSEDDTDAHNGRSSKSTTKKEKGGKKYVKKRLKLMKKVKNSSYKTAQIMKFLVRIGVMIFIYVVFFGVYLSMTISTVAERSQFEFSFESARGQQYLARKAIYDLREFAVHLWQQQDSDSEVTASKIFTELEELDISRFAYLHGNPASSVPSTFDPVDSKFSVHLQDICSITQLKDCDGFLNGLAHEGYQTSIGFFAHMAESWAIRLGVASEKLNSNRTALRQYLQELEVLIELEDKVLRPAAIVLASSSSNDLDGLTSSISSTNATFVIVFVLINFYIFAGIAQPLLTKLAWEFGQTRGLAKMVPSKTRMEALKIRHESSNLEGDQQNSTKMMLYGSISKYRIIASILLLLVGLGFWAASSSGKLGNAGKIFQQHGSDAGAMALAVGVAIIAPVGTDCIAYPALHFMRKASPSAILDIIIEVQAVGLGVAGAYFYLSGAHMEPLAIKYGTIGGALGAVVGGFAVRSSTDFNLTFTLAAAIIVGVWIGYQVASSNLRARTFPKFAVENVAADFIGIGIVGGLLMSLTGGGLSLLSFFVMSTYYWLDDVTAQPTATCMTGFVSIILWVIRRVEGSPRDAMASDISFAAGPAAVVVGVVLSRLSAHIPIGSRMQIFSLGAIIQVIWGILLFATIDTFHIFLFIVVTVVCTSITIVISVGGAIGNFKNSDKKKEDM